VFAVEGVNGVVSAGAGFDAFDDLAIHRVDDVPVALLQRRQINIGTVGREGKAIAAARIRFFPENFFSEDVETLELVEGGDVEAAGFGISGDAFDVGGFAVGGKTLRGDAFDEFVVVIDVEDHQAVAAVFEVIADAGRGDVEVALVGGRRGDEQKEKGAEAKKLVHWDILGRRLKNGIRK